jgi:hypothetical protein
MFLLVAVLIALTMVKTKQMKQALATAPHPPQLAIDEVQNLYVRLRLNLGCFLVITVALLAASSAMPASWFAFCGGCLTIPTHLLLSNVLYTEYNKELRRRPIEDYVASIVSAWD